ncbi:MAG: MMPL family transporter [Mycobacterium leprae]
MSQTRRSPQSTPRTSHSSHWLIRFAPVILIIWVAVIAGAVVYSPRLKSALRDESLAIEGSESYATREVISQELQTGDAQSLVLVFQSNTMKVMEPDYRVAVQSVVERAKAIDKVTQVSTYWDTQQELLLGKDGRSTIALIQVDSTTVDTKDRVVPALRALAKDAPAGLEVHVTGGQAVARDLSTAGEESSAKAEKVIIPVVLIVLLLIFGTGVSATLPLGLGIISVMVANGLFYFYARGHASHFLVPTMITMIGMGVGVDYSLFLVSRFREELAAGKDRAEAVRTTIATSGKSILFSGATVLVSVASLYTVNSALVRALVLSMVLVTLVAVLAATTLLPVLLYMLGHRINSLRIPFFGKAGNKGGRFWHAWAHMVMRSPWVFTVLVMVPLLVIA